jgi:hypothetical protein
MSEENITITNENGEVVVYNKDHLHDFFNNQMYQRIMALSETDKARYFQMMTEYHDIVEAIIPPEARMLLGQTALLKSASEGQDDGLPWVEKDTESNALLQQYNEWKSQQGN